MVHLALPLLAAIAAAPADRPAELLASRCTSCHGPDRPKAGLRLDGRDALLRGGASGPVVHPGRSAASLLLRRVGGTSAHGDRMPPKGSPLTADEIALLRDWIDRGAPWPDARQHWSFQPVRRPVPPAVSDPGWVRNAVDRFVLARLDREGVTPSPEADRRILARRVTLDLTGLPPTPEEAEAFVNDTRPDAYERLVDRLLASPAYGERWARPWLDLAHYADSDGYLTDQKRPVAWRYRQWLIDALNADMPFDRFTLAQLAGDLPPGGDRLGTGFLRQSLSNREGGADLEEFRVEQVVDRVSTVGTAWLGLTVGCARCHDHKFDPVSQREFFALYAFLDGADEVNVDAPLPGEAERHAAALPHYRARREALLAPVAAALDELQSRWETKLRDAAANPGRDHVWDRQWEVLGLIWGGDRGEGQLEGCHIVLTPPERRTDDERERLRDYFLERGSVIDPARFRDLKLDDLAADLKKLRAGLPAVTRAPVVRETPHPRPVRVHERGDFRRPAAAVGRGTPSALPGGAAADRLGLARWLVSAEQPLTPRVTVNRHWQELFGTGLVRTPDDFGVRGDRPSHPELLDWLAAEFRDGGWSVKHMHRLIVTSATYRQSSKSCPELRDRDPNNRWLARQTPLRLTADGVRDAALAVAGVLDRRVGGPSVFPPQPDSVSKEGFENTWVAGVGADRFRRGLYTWHQRTSPFAQQVTFDAPSTSRPCARRERSNSPLQALTLLNDEVFADAAKVLAGRVLCEVPSADFDLRLDRAYRLTLARPPRSAERERLAAYFRRQTEVLRAEPGAVAWLAPRCAASADDPVTAAAWTGVAGVLLNLHEFITRD
jgi:mono/diheme cytochrome c family protein